MSTLVIFTDPRPKSVVIADSLTKDFFHMKNTKVITERGGTPQKALEFIREFPHAIKGYKVIILHVGTNWLSGIPEWKLYLKMVNLRISREEYDAQISALNPPPAVGKATKFRETYQKLIDLVKEINKEATILVSSIIPRLWDQERRHLVRKSYNNILHNFGEQDRVFFIPSYRPFFDCNRNLKSNLFNRDGLHLSDKGATVLRTYFCDRIDKALRGIIKQPPKTQPSVTYESGNHLI